MMFGRHRDASALNEEKRDSIGLDWPSGREEDRCTLPFSVRLNLQNDVSLSSPYVAKGWRKLLAVRTRCYDYQLQSQPLNAAIPQ